MPSYSQTLIHINANAIDPVWLLAPKVAMIRDLPYPVPIAKLV